MVKKQGSRIARNPKIQAAAKKADEWISQGGIDPETSPETNKQPINKPDAESEDKGKKYPHRISFDLDKAQYKRLKWASFDSERTMNEILREAIEEWMKERSY